MSSGAPLAIPRPDADSARLVKQSIARLAGRELELTQGFYSHLFSMLPQTRDLFPEDMAEQRVRLLKAILASINSLHDPEGMESRLQALGEIHYYRGIADDQYQYVGHALIRTLRDVVTADWSTWLSSAWVSVYSWMIQHMVVGAQRARARGEFGSREALFQAAERRYEGLLPTTGAVPAVADPRTRPQPDPAPAVQPRATTYAGQGYAGQGYAANGYAANGYAGNGYAGNGFDGAEYDGSEYGGPDYGGQGFGRSEYGGQEHGGQEYRGWFRRGAEGLPQTGEVQAYPAPAAYAEQPGSAGRQPRADQQPGEDPGSQYLSAQEQLSWYGYPSERATADPATPAGGGRAAGPGMEHATSWVRYPQLAELGLQPGTGSTALQPPSQSGSLVSPPVGRAGGGTAGEQATLEQDGESAYSLAGATPAAGVATSGPATSGPATSGPATSGPATSGPATSIEAVATVYPRRRRGTGSV